jgi:hypothetical protein
MNQWTLTFPACIEYSAHDEITVEIDLIYGTFPVTVGAKLDSAVSSASFSRVMPNGLALILPAAFPRGFALPQGHSPGLWT